MGLVTSYFSGVFRGRSTTEGGRSREGVVQDDSGLTVEGETEKEIRHGEAHIPDPGDVETQWCHSDHGRHRT